MRRPMSSCGWLAANLDIPVIGPESMAGKFHTRAEWIRAGACDVTRTDVRDVGGTGPSLKITHLAPAFGMDCEVHRGGAGNLTPCAAPKKGRWYEWGLLHPFLSYSEPPEYLNSRPDPVDADGFVHLSQRPGLGEDINLYYINNNLVSR